MTKLISYPFKLVHGGVDHPSTVLWLTNPIRAWLRYPFAMGGPLAVFVYAGGTTAALLSLWAPIGLQFWIGLAAIAGLWTANQVARNRFARARGLRAPSGLMPPGRSSRVYFVVVSILAAIAPLSFGWRDAWVWVIACVAWLAQEVYVHVRWRARGCPGDPRWAVSR